MDHASRNAAPYLYPDESILPADYPVHCGYAYVVETTDGEVWVESSNLSGSVSSLIADIQHWRKGAVVRHIRRCNLDARILDAQTRSD